MSVSNGPNLGVMINALTGDAFPTDFRKFLRAVDVLLQGAVKSKTLTAPPGSPANGDRYIVGASPTGAWAGQAKSIAVWTTDNPTTQSGLWEFYAPQPGWMVANIADTTVYVYFAGAWTAIGGGGGGSTTFIGLTDVPGSYSGQGNKAVHVNNAETALEFRATYLRVNIFANGLGVNGELLFNNIIPDAVTFPASASLSPNGNASANATGSTTYTFKKNGTSFATLTFGAGSSSGTWTQASASTFNGTSDVLTIAGPATADATLADVGFCLKGVRS